MFGDIKHGVGAALCVLPVYHAGKVVRAAHASTTGGPRTRRGRPLPWRARRRENGQTADNPARSRNASPACSHEAMSNYEACATFPHLPSGDESRSLSTGSAFRDCPRNHHIRRKAFCDRAHQLLPDLAAKIESTATGLYGPELEGQPRLKSLADLLERRAKFCDWFAQGKPADVVVPFGAMPDGEITPRFARCWQAALKALPNLMPRFALTADGFRIPLPHGCYRLYRSVLLDANLDEGNDTTVEVDPTLLHKGGLYRMSKGADGIRLESLQTAIPRWKVALRMLRKHRITMRAELLRRMRAGVAFEFSRQKGAVKVTLKAGKMPREVRIQYCTRAAIVRDRLNRVREALAELEAEGERAAETFAANPTIIAAQRAAERESAITAFRGARDRLWQVARQCYRRDSLPPWPYRTPAEIRGCARRGISSRQRMRIENAIQGFTRAYEEATAYGWNPLDDESLTEHHHNGAPQRILAVEFASSSMR